ncbi:unnamed protein product [Chilo suppressalis]|uniref:FP protein C-terminal domain-containing protein n=1 Tax=Chilo suppressalis TaxID=168631 RepID=A0ABN8B6P0_CHISP|nr:unnamed protein product [Chilo suppressalis]
MPLKRTPPPTKTLSDTDLKNAGVAEPDVDLSASLQNITKNRMKRKHGDAEMQEFIAEMRTMFANFVSDQNSKLQTLQETIMEIKEQNSNTQTFIDMISEKYDELHKEIEKLKEERRENWSYIENLENKIENIERNVSSSKIEIRNVPVLLKENKEVLLNLVQNIGNILNLQLQKSDFRDVYRGFAKPDKIKPIIVEFSSVLHKEKLLMLAKKLRKSDPNSLNTSRLKLEGEPKQFFLAECLTARARRLFYLSRDFAKTFKYGYCWTSYGKIYLRKKEGAPQIRINAEADLTKLKNAESI